MRAGLPEVLDGLRLAISHETAATPLLRGASSKEMSRDSEDVGQALAGHRLAPEVVGLEAIWVGGVARPVVPAAVEGQELAEQAALRSAPYIAGNGCRSAGIASPVACA